MTLGHQWNIVECVDLRETDFSPFNSLGSWADVNALCWSRPGSVYYSSSQESNQVREGIWSERAAPHFCSVVS